METEKPKFQIIRETHSITFWYDNECYSYESTLKETCLYKHVEESKIVLYSSTTNEVTPLVEELLSLLKENTRLISFRRRKKVTS